MAEVLPKSRQELLVPGGNEIILFPHPAVLVSHAFKKPNSDAIIYALVAENSSILDAICSRVDSANVYLVQSELIMFKKNLPLGYGLITATPPAIQGFTNIRLGGQESIPFEERTHGERIFLRDLFSNINGEYFLVDPTVSPDVKEGENVIRSPLGDGGKVLPAGKSIIVTQDLWTDPVARKHLMMLRAQGYKAAYVPFVDKSSQPEDKRNFVPNHIDGHAVLLLDQDQNPHFLYARSYAKQAAQVSKALRSAADYVGAVAVEVNDQGLPFLAFNMLQLRDGSVVISASRESQALIEAVEKIVGKENTLVTSEPIEQTPLLAKGAIRCMANSAPFSVIQRFNPVITNSV